MMIESDGPGGAEMIMLQMSEELRRRGHEVVPVLPARGVGWLGERYREKGFEPETFAIERALDPACLRGIVRVLRRRRVDLVHSHEFAMAVYGTVAARLIGLPHVVTMHGNQGTMEAWRRRLALRFAFGWSDAVVAVSDHTRRHLEEALRLEPGVVTTIPNGVPLPSGRREPARREFDLAEDETVLLSVGSLIPRKGHAALLRALAEVRRQEPSLDWRLLIAGRGEEKDRLETLAREGGISDRVHLLGYRADVSDLLAAADIFVMPSLWEGLPLAILEAMRSGTAVVATAASGIPEAIRHGQEGLLLEPGDEKGLSAALVELMSDPSRREALARAGRDRAEAEFSIERMMDRYEALYRGL